MQFIAYLNFNGNCREAFDFYREAFKGDITMRMTYGESPMRDEMPADSRDLIMHNQLEADGAILMGADGPPPPPQEANKRPRPAAAPALQQRDASRRESNLKLMPSPSGSVKRCRRIARPAAQAAAARCRRSRTPSTTTMARLFCSDTSPPSRGATESSQMFWPP